MEAYNRFNRVIFEWERMVLRLVGHDILGEEILADAIAFERNLITYFVYFMFCCTFIAIFYSFAAYDSLTKISNLIFCMIAAQV